MTVNEVLTAYYDAYNSEDPNLLATVLDEAVVLRIGGGTPEGRSAYLDTYKMTTTMFRRAHGAGAGMFLERDAAGKLAVMYAVRGACFDAQRWVDEEQRHPPLPSKESERLVRTAGMVAAFIAVDRLEPESALAILTDLGSPSDREEYWAYVLYALGQHALLAGIPAEGLRRIMHHLELYPGLHGEGSAAGPMLDAVRANLYLAIGEIDSARTLVDNHVTRRLWQSGHGCICSPANSMMPRV